MELSVRLQALADYVQKGAHVIDVGTDHAYIPIYLMKNHIAESCIATDINRGPLEKAKHNMGLYHVEDIKLKQTNGLIGIAEDAADVIMISGMGGYLISDILKGNLPLVRNAKQLILQPQQDSDVVRKVLHEIGFKIKDENFVKDEQKYYTIISAVPGKEHYEHPVEYLYGRVLMQKGLPAYKEWLRMKLEKLEAIEAALKHQETASTMRRKQELQFELKIHREVMQHVFK